MAAEMAAPEMAEQELGHEEVVEDGADIRTVDILQQFGAAAADIKKLREGM